MTRDPQPFLAREMQWHCQPLSAWMLRAQCDRNRARVAQADRAKGMAGKFRTGEQGADVAIDRVALACCRDCPGIVPRFTQGLEPEPREIRALEELVTRDAGEKPPPSVRITSGLTHDVAARGRSLALNARVRAGKAAARAHREIPPKPTDGSARNLYTKPGKAFIYYRTEVGGLVDRSTGTADWAEAIRWRDQFEAARGQTGRQPHAVAPRPRDGSARNLYVRDGRIIYERMVGSARIAKSTGTHDWAEAAQWRDAYERQHQIPLVRADRCARGHDLSKPENIYTRPSGSRQCGICKRARRPETRKEGLMAQEPCACGCGQPAAPWSGRGRRPAYAQGHSPRARATASAEVSATSGPAPALPPGMQPVAEIPAPRIKNAWELPYLDALRANPGASFALTPADLTGDPKDWAKAANVRRRREGFEFCSRRGTLYARYVGAA